MGEHELCQALGDARRSSGFAVFDIVVAAFIWRPLLRHVLESMGFVRCIASVPLKPTETQVTKQCFEFIRTSMTEMPGLPPTGCRRPMLAASVLLPADHPAKGIIKILRPSRFIRGQYLQREDTLVTRLRASLCIINFALRECSKFSNIHIVITLRPNMDESTSLYMFANSREIVYPQLVGMHSTCSALMYY